MTYKEFKSENERSLVRKNHFFNFTKLPNGRWLITVNLMGMEMIDVKGELHTWEEATTIVTDIQASCIWNNLTDSEWD